jgi:hypothetical protein
VEALTVITWLWGNKYSREYVDKLARGLTRNIKQDFRFLVIEPDQSDPLIGPGCLIRLKMFDPFWARARGITGRIVCIDLDVVVTGPLDPLFDRPEPFLILTGANSVNPCPFNGSLMMLRAGKHPEVWGSFTVIAAEHVPFYKFPDDQSWIYHKLPNAAGWNVGLESGIWSFRKRGWPSNDVLPPNSRLVCFPGQQDPGQFTGLKWIQQHWR